MELRYQIIWKLKVGTFKKYNDCRIFLRGSSKIWTFSPPWPWPTRNKKKEREGETGLLAHNNKTPVEHVGHLVGLLQTVHPPPPQSFFCKLTPVARLSCVRVENPTWQGTFDLFFLFPPRLPFREIDCLVRGSGVRRRWVDQSLSRPILPNLTQGKVGFRENFLSFFWGGWMGRPPLAKERERRSPRGDIGVRKEGDFSNKKFPPHFPPFCSISF